MAKEYGKEVEKDICFWNSNLSINLTKESKDQNMLDNCSVISDWSQTGNEKCGEELDEDILWESNSNISSTTESKHQNQLDNCSVISDWSQTEDGYSESDVGHLMQTLFRTQLYTDVTFYPKVGEESLSAHRVVLAAKCQSFVELLFGKKTKEAEDMQMKVEISNIHFSIFKKIVEYFYTDEIDFEDMPTMLDIFLGAKHYQVQSLVERCESCIESLELAEDNVCSILQMCNERNIEELRDRCLSYIQENTQKVISSEAFQKCIYNTVYVICNLPALSLNSEEQLIDAVAGWANAQPLHIKPQLITPLLSSIRFLALSPKEAGSVIERHPDIMTAEDALKIMLILNGSLENRSLQNLPTWCNRKTQNRCSKQSSIESDLKGTASKTQRSGKILIPLKPVVESQEISKQSSILQIECIKGRHHINAIKILVPGLPPKQSIMFTVSVKNVQQWIPLHFQKRFTTYSTETLFEFVRVINIYEGQVIYIEIAAKSVKGFSLFQLDENRDSLKNEHFQCCATSEPADKKQFAISEIHYSPQGQKMIKDVILPLKKGTNPKTQRNKKLLIALNPAAETQKMTKQSSTLQIECIEGRHEINAIKVSFPSLSLNQSVKLIVSVTKFSFKQQRTVSIFHKRFITKSEEKLFEFFQGIKLREDDLVNIEVIAKSTKDFSLFQLHENQDSLINEHFQCYVTSDPADTKQFIISEVQYRPQEETMLKEDIPSLKKGVNECQLPRRKTKVAGLRTKRFENKRGLKDEKDIPPFQEATDEGIASNSEKDNGNQLISCPNTKKSGEDRKERKMKRTETLEGAAQTSSVVDGNTKNMVMSCFLEENSRKEDLEKVEVDDAVDNKNDMPECDREKIKSDQGNSNPSILPYSGEKRTRKYDPKMQETDGERKDKPKSDKERKVSGGGEYCSETLVTSEKTHGNQTLKIRENNGKGTILDSGKNILISDNENNGQIILSGSITKRTKVRNIHGQDVFDRERKEMSETDRKKTTNGEIHGDQKTLSFSCDRGMKEVTQQQEETDGLTNDISLRDRRKAKSDDRNDEPIILSICSIKGRENENWKQNGNEKEIKKIPWEDRRSRTSDETTGAQVAFPQSSEERTEKESLQNQDTNSERKDISARYQESTVGDDAITRQVNLPWCILNANIKEKLKEREEILEESLEVRRDDPELFNENRFETDRARKQEENDRERNITAEKDRERMARDHRYCSQMTELRLDVKRPNENSKVGDEKRKETPEEHSEVRVNGMRNDHHEIFRPIIIKTSDVEMKQGEEQEKKKELLEKDDKRRESEEIKFDEDSFYPLAIWLCVLILIAGICVKFVSKFLFLFL